MEKKFYFLLSMPCKANRHCNAYVTCYSIDIECTMSILKNVSILNSFICKPNATVAYNTGANVEQITMLFLVKSAKQQHNNTKMFNNERTVWSILQCLHGYCILTKQRLLFDPSELWFLRTFLFSQFDFGIRVEDENKLLLWNVFKWLRNKGTNAIVKRNITTCL